MRELILSALYESAEVVAQLMRNDDTIKEIERAGNVLADAFKSGNRVYSCGNGGSMCDAMHFAEELSGRFRGDRRALPAQAISDVGHMTCVSNDFGYDQVFSRYLEAHGRRRDVLLAISTSGNSPSILMAAEAAHSRGMWVIGLTGNPDGALCGSADQTICTPGAKYADRVQELHIKVIHILIEIVERQMGFTS